MSIFYTTSNMVPKPWMWYHWLGCDQGVSWERKNSSSVRREFSVLIMWIFVRIKMIKILVKILVKICIETISDTLRYMYCEPNSRAHTTQKKRCSHQADKSVCLFFLFLLKLALPPSTFITDWYSQQQQTSESIHCATSKIAIS